MTLRVGITGGIGSGKSALTELLEAAGVPVVDADVAARIVVQPGRPALTEIARRFGNDVLLPDGNLNRPLLRQRVFSDSTARRDLEAITHPRIRDELATQLEAAESDYVVLSSPLLVESSQIDMVDVVVVVDVPESVQIERTMSRDGNDEELVRQILGAQIPRNERLKKADIVIDNSTSLDALRVKADELHQRLVRLAQQSHN